MEIKHNPQVGIPSFGVIYRQRAGGNDSFMSVDGVSVKLKLWQRISIKFRRMYALLKRRIDYAMVKYIRG
jgi:hypothetical protein